MFLLFVTLCSTFALFEMTQRNKITSISYRRARCNAYACTTMYGNYVTIGVAMFSRLYKIFCFSLSSVFAQRWTRFCYWHWFYISPDCIIMFFCWFHFAQCLVFVGSFRYHAQFVPHCYPHRLILLLFVFRGTWSVFSVYLMLVLVLAVVRPKIASAIEQKRVELCNNLWKVFNLQN